MAGDEGEAQTFEPSVMDLVSGIGEVMKEGKLALPVLDDLPARALERPHPLQERTGQGWPGARGSR